MFSFQTHFRTLMKPTDKMKFHIMHNSLQKHASCDQMWYFMLHDFSRFIVKVGLYLFIFSQMTYCNQAVSYVQHEPQNLKWKLNSNNTTEYTSNF